MASFMFQSSLSWKDALFSTFFEISQNAQSFSLKRLHSPSDANQLLATSKRVLLHLMAHPLVRVRRLTYEESLRVVRSGVNVRAAADNPDNAPSQICRWCSRFCAVAVLTCSTSRCFVAIYWKARLVGSERNDTL